MIVDLIVIVAAYGMSIVLVHVLHSRSRSRHGDTSLHRGRISSLPSGPEQYVLISDHNQQQVEWIIRLLQWYSFIKGKDVRVYVQDEGSSDDTLDIVWRFARQDAVQLLAPESIHKRNHCGRKLDRDGDADLKVRATVVELNRPSDLAKIPLYNGEASGVQ